MAHGPEDGGFLSRWSRRKVLVRQGDVPADPVPPPAVVAQVQPLAPSVAAAAATEAPAAAPQPTAELAPPAPTLADVAALGRDSDYTRFVAPGVDTGVKNAALKKLFTDPHFNVMDGLDTYIDDYGIPDPLPAGMLRQMAQSQFLGLFTEAPPVPPDAAAPATPPPTPTPPAQAIPDEDAALRLQPHHAAGPAGPGEGPEPDAGRQC
jgi:hypothetical protein